MATSYLSRTQMRRTMGLLPRDVTVVCSNVTFCMHKERLVACGQFFRAAFDERYMFQEAITSTITIPEDAKTFGFLAFFAYTGALLSYTNTGEHAEMMDRELVERLQATYTQGIIHKEPTTPTGLDPTLESIVLLSDVYYMADKYCVADLQTLCANEAVVLAQDLASKSLDWLPAGSLNLEVLGSWIKGVYAKTTRFDLALKESVCIYVHRASDRARQERFYFHLEPFFSRILAENRDLSDSVGERAQPPPPTCPGCLSPEGCDLRLFAKPWYIGWICECDICGSKHDHCLQATEFEWQPGQWPMHERWRMLWNEIVANSNGINEFERMQRALTLYREVRTGIVHLPEDDVETFQKFIAVICTDDYNDGLVYNQDSDVDSIMMQVMLESAKLYCMADKLLAEDVKKAAVLEVLDKMVELIYTKTAREDVELKERLCWLFSRQLTEQHLWVSVLPIFQRYWDFHMGVMAYICKSAVVCLKCQKSSTTRVVMMAPQYAIYGCFVCQRTRRITKRFLR
ncbi:hypothetical protein PoMZ_10496 [Pyricularia oryzae]|uniref:BTB domain-containing protein n=1 Tax=Pyricularia oryzae TaxID=318829 RepID=A0A4P7MXK3_PYROR|nr:hypothetical protein PoMZ_10496 [Pyricularia oryzae]